MTVSHFLQDTETAADVSALQVAFDALPWRVAVVNAEGIIVAVNKSWLSFTQKSGLSPETNGVGNGYYDVCERGSGACDRGWQGHRPGGS